MLRRDSTEPISSPLLTQAPAAGEALVERRTVRVEFGPLAAVRDVSFTLRPGNLLGLIGPNGAGKTTLLRALVGIQPVTRGSVCILGTDLATADEQLLRHVGFTPDTPSFYENLTVSDFLHFIAMAYGLDHAEAEERI